MNVLVVSQYFWPENFRVNDLVTGLSERGHQVTVLTGLPNYPSGRFFPGYGKRGPWREKYGGADVIRVPLIPRGTGSKLLLALNYASFVLAASWVATFRLRAPFDAIFVFETSPITVAIPAVVARWRFRVPILFWVLDLWPMSLSTAGVTQSRTLLGAMGLFVRWVYSKCALVLISSRGFTSDVSRHGVPQERIRYFPNWIESGFRPVEAHDPAAIPPLPEGFRVMFAGNIGGAQDFPSILAAADRLKARSDLHWIVLGDGSMASWAKEEVRRRHLDRQVHFYGQHPPERMPHFFAAADALLVSLKREPIFALTVPGKVTSYLASGRPVLAMLDGEGAEIVGLAKAGFACPAEDSEALAANVEKLLALSRAERARLGENGMRYAEEHFGRERQFDHLEEWLAEAVSETSAS